MCTENEVVDAVSIGDSSAMKMIPKPARNSRRRARGNRRSPRARRTRRSARTYKTPVTPRPKMTAGSNVQFASIVI